MKNILFLVLLVCNIAMSQIKGNKEVETRYFPAVNLTDIQIGLYANITIDMSLNEGITISADSNLFEYIDTEVVDGSLKLNQLKWISPSQRMEILIGAPKLTRVEQQTNDVLNVIHLNLPNFNVMALNGTIVLEGEVQNLAIGAANGTVDARKIMVKEVFLNIWGPGKAQVNVTDLLDAKLSNDASLELVTKPKKIKGDVRKVLAKTKHTNTEETRYISFKIKNNSLNRNNFYVIGPKPDGKKFSYGFPMMPGKTRKEKWTIGTKIYKVSSLGLKKLLVKIEAKDENTTLRLFD